MKLTLAKIGAIFNVCHKCLNRKKVPGRLKCQKCLDVRSNYYIKNKKKIRAYERERYLKNRKSKEPYRPCYSYVLTKDRKYFEKKIEVS